MIATFSTTYRYVEIEIEYDTEDFEIESINGLPVICYSIDTINDLGENVRDYHATKNDKEFENRN